MGFVPNKCQIRVDGKKRKAKACPFRVDWLGGVKYFWGETGAVYIKPSPFKGMLVRYFYFDVLVLCVIVGSLLTHPTRTIAVEIAVGRASVALAQLFLEMRRLEHSAFLYACHAT